MEIEEAGIATENLGKEIMLSWGKKLPPLQEMKKRRARAETKEEIEEGGGAAVSLPATASRACVGQWSSASSPGARAWSNVSGGGGSNENGRKEMD